MSVRRVPIMGGGGIMRTAAKVAGISVVNGVRGRAGLSVVPSAAEQSMIRGASSPVSAAIASATHPSGGDGVAIAQRPVWELDDWEFVGVEDELVKPSGGGVGGEPIARVVFGGPPTLQEAKDAAQDLKNAIDKVYLSSPKSSTMKGSVSAGPVSGILGSVQSSERKAFSGVSPVPKTAFQAFALLSESSIVQCVVTSIASDPNVWTAVMENADLIKFLESNKIVVRSQDDGFPKDKHEPSNATQFEHTTEKPKRPFWGFLQDMKLKVVQVLNYASTHFQDLFGSSSGEANHASADGEAKPSFFNDTHTLFGLAVAVILMVILKRA